jgi:MFS family permease
MSATIHAPLTASQAERRYLILSGLQWLPAGLVIPIMVLLFQARGVELPVVGAIFALYSAVVIALELPTGSLADVLGRRRTLLVSRVLAVVSLGAMAVAQDAVGFGLAMVVSGVSRSLQSGPLEAWYVDAVHAADPDAEVRRGISRGWAVEAVAIAVGAVTGGLIPGLVGSATLPAGLTALSVPFLGAAALTVVGFVAVALLMREPAVTTRRPALRDIVRDVPVTIRGGLDLAGRDRTIRLVLGAMLAFGFALSALEVLSPLQFAVLLGGEEQASAAYGVLVTLAFLGTAGGSAVAPRVAEAVRSAPRAAALTTGLIALALIGMAIGSTFVVVAAMYVAVYVFAGVAGPLKNDTLHQRVDATQRATLLSVASLGQMLGGLVGSLVTPILAVNGFGVAWVGAAAVVLVGAGLLSRLPTRVERVGREPVPA